MSKITLNFCCPLHILKAKLCFFICDSQHSNTAIILYTQKLLKSEDLCTDITA